MKQKIKKVAYTIPLCSDLVKSGNIIVESFAIPNKKDKKHQAISIAVEIEGREKRILHNGESLCLENKSRSFVKP